MPLRRLLRLLPSLTHWLQLVFLFAGACLIPAAGLAASTHRPPLLLAAASSPTAPAALYAADVNHDGLPDLISIDAGAASATAITHILLGDGHGGFTESARLTTAGTSLAFGDFTGHGNVDLAWLTVDSSGISLTAHIAPGRGDGTFAPTLDYAPISVDSTGTDGRPFALAWLTAAHLHDPSAEPDLLAEDLNHNTLYAFTLNRFAGTVAFASASLPDGTGPLSIADLDRDGRDDVLIAGSAVQVFLSNPAGLGNRVASSLRISSAGPLAVGDLEGNPYPDLLLAAPGGLIDLYRGTGDGTFAPAVSLASVPVAAPPTSLFLIPKPLAAADLLLISSSSIRLARSTGGGSLTVASVPTPPGNALYVAADFNADGFPDLAAASATGITIWFGTPEGTLVPAATQEATHAPAPTATAFIPTSVVLALCVDGSVTFPCPAAAGASPPVVAALSLYFGQVVDGTADVTSSDGSALSTSSTITFFDGTASFCTIPVLPSSTCPASAGVGFEAGTHILSATYSGDATHAPSASNMVSVVVLPDITSANLTSSLNPAPFGAAVTFTATLTGNYANPTGNVTFLDGTSRIGTGSLNAAGIATLTLSSLAVGTHPITASYAGTPDFTPATSAVVNQVISPPPLAATSTSISSSLNPSLLTNPVTFTASVTTAGTHNPTGSVTFLDGSTTLGNGTLNSTGTATFITASLTVGIHTITASYPGDSVNAASVSAMLTQVVNNPPVVVPAGFTLTVTPAPVTIGVGLSASLIAKVTTTGGFSQPITLACTGLPSESACTFGIVTFPPGGGSTTLQLSTMAPHTCGTTQPYFYGSLETWPAALPLAAPLLAGLLCFLPGRKKITRKGRLFKSLLAFVALAAILELSGCGNCTDLGTFPGTYTVNVYATASGGSAQAQALIVNVKT